MSRAGSAAESRSDEARVEQRYVCTECSEWQIVKVAPSDSVVTIGYWCDDCQEVTDHEPSGTTDWY